MRKRRQYYISQFNFNNVNEDKGMLYFTEADRVTYPNSENLLFDLIYRIQEREYNNEIKNDIPEMFILKATNIDQDKFEQVKQYENIIKNGVFIDGIKYVYSQKSSSMIRTQKTVYVREDIKEELEEHITLGVKPTKTVMAKWLSNQGLLMSTSHLMPDIPNIVVVQDFEKIVVDDVKMVVPYKITLQDKINNKELVKSHEAENERYKQYIEKREELKELFTQEYLSENFRVVRGGNYQTAYKWTTEDKRVKVEELEKPLFLRQNNQGKLFAIYSENQTEEIKRFPVIKELLGYETKIVENNENEINCFDGMGLVSLDYMKKIEKFLQIKNTNAIQGRLPYIKGLFIKFDFKQYLKNELDATEMVDLWGDTHKANDIDIIVTESCLKAKIELDEDGKSSWLFKNMEDYYDRLDKYGYKHFGISNFAPDHLKKYAPTTYQLINALNLTEKDLRELARPEIKAIANVIRRADTASVKLFLDMVSSNVDDGVDNDGIKTKLDYIKDAIELNERMIFDKEVQKTIFELAESSIYDIMRGRIRIPGRYQYITGDIIGLCEWIAYREPNKVEGFLNKNEFYCEGMENEEYIFARYPLTHYSEVKIAPFIESNNKYMKHLHNIIQLNTYDLTMPQLAGADVDGDTVNVINPDIKLEGNKTILDAVISDYVIVNPDDGAMAKSDEINIDTILQFEKANLHNLTGAVTNINTTICDRAVVKGTLVDRDLAISTLKSKQGEIIDSAKTGQLVTIPELLVKDNPKLPYFFKYIYGGNEYQYLRANSPLSKLTLTLEKWLRSSKILQYQDVIGTEIEDKGYLDMTKLHNLMIDTNKFDSETYFNLHDALVDIHNSFSSARGGIYQISKNIDKFNRNEETKDERKIISKLYAELYEETKKQAKKSCIEVLGHYNPSILASVATRIAYEDSKTSSNGINSNKNYLFGWIVAPEGIVENLKVNEDINKTKITKMDAIDLPTNITNMKVINGIASLSARDVNFPTSLMDGSYSILSKNGKRYATNIVEEIANIETTESKTIKNSGTKVLNDYPATVAFLQKEKDELEEIFASNKIKVGLEKGEYLSLYSENEFLGSFTKDSIINTEHRIDLNEYVGQDVTVEIAKMNKNSLDILLVS